MYQTSTKTNTYTVLDIRKTFEGCEADIRTIARRTGKWSMDYVDDIFHDILLLSESNFLNSVDVVLLEKNTNKPLRASKFLINDLGSATNSERAGKNNDWPNTQDTKLCVILSYTTKWFDLKAEDRKLFSKKLINSWQATSIDNKFPKLRKSNAQLYASNGYELQKTNFK